MLTLLPETVTHEAGPLCKWGPVALYRWRLALEEIPWKASLMRLTREFLNTPNRSELLLQVNMTFPLSGTAYPPGTPGRASDDYILMAKMEWIIKKQPQFQQRHYCVYTNQHQFPQQSANMSLLPWRRHREKCGLSFRHIHQVQTQRLLTGWLYAEKTDCQNHIVYRICCKHINRTHLATVQTCTSCCTKWSVCNNCHSECIWNE